MKKTIFYVLKILFILLTLLIIYHELFVVEDSWLGIYYQKGNSHGNAIYSPRFTFKEECIGWAINERGLRPEDKNVPLGDLWECNKNCKLAQEYTTLINAAQQFKQELLDDNKGPLFSCDNGGFDGADWLRGDF